MDNNEKETYYTTKEVAKMLKVAYLTVYRWIRIKKLPAYKFGKQYRVRKIELESFIDKNRN